MYVLADPYLDLPSRTSQYPPEMGTETCSATINAPDAISPSSSCSIDNFELIKESSLVGPRLSVLFDRTDNSRLGKNYGDALLPYPSPPVEAELDPIPTTRFNGHTSTIPDSADSENLVVAISTSFNPTSHPVKPDLIFSTSDMVLFYAHSKVLKRFSSEAFDRVLWNRSEKSPTSQVMAGSEVIHDVPDSSAVFNVILHSLYGTSPAQNSPSFDTLITAVDRMSFYGINPKDVVTKQTPLYQLLLTHAPLFPVHLYSLAGCYGLEDLAVSSSSQLLSFSISKLSDELATRMGAIYLKRLLCLHLNRMNSLKEILLVPPFPHPPTKECDFTEQKALTRAWTLVSAQLAWDARPDISTIMMRKAYEPLKEKLTCELCQSGLEKRIREIVIQWASAQPTI